MVAIPTVKVKYGDGYAVINESDYDPAIHTLIESKAAPVEPEPVPEPEVEPAVKASTDAPLPGSASGPKKKKG